MKKGHGDVHSLMYSTGTAQKWLDSGVKWLFFFQDTNGVTFRSLPSALGVSAKNQFAMNSITVPRLPKQALGGIAQLTNEKTKEILTINVEYNQLGPLLESTGDKKGKNTFFCFVWAYQKNTKIPKKNEK